LSIRRRVLTDALETTAYLPRPTLRVHGELELGGVDVDGKIYGSEIRGRPGGLKRLTRVSAAGTAPPVRLRPPVVVDHGRRLAVHEDVQLAVSDTDRDVSVGYVMGRDLPHEEAVLETCKDEGGGEVVKG